MPNSDGTAYGSSHFNSAFQQERAFHRPVWWPHSVTFGMAGSLTDEALARWELDTGFPADVDRPGSAAKRSGRHQFASRPMTGPAQLRHVSRDHWPSVLDRSGPAQTPSTVLTGDHETPRRGTQPAVPAALALTGRTSESPRQLCKRPCQRWLVPLPYSGKLFTGWLEPWIRQSGPFCLSAGQEGLRSQPGRGKHAWH
jgi:hypothetical protein